jgi:hypothetical protein
MRKRLFKTLLPVLVLLWFALLTGGCSSDSRPQLEAEVKIANNSVYVWNRGETAWSGGTVYLNKRSDKISKTIATVNPGGFAQLPLREFRKGSTPGSPRANISAPQTVLVEVEGYAPRSFDLE